MILANIYYRYWKKYVIKLAKILNICAKLIGCEAQEGADRIINI